MAPRTKAGQMTATCFDPPRSRKPLQNRSRPQMTVPNQLGVDYNAHVIEAILTHVAPAMGWR
jgi:hypothetical protein